jgi:hypothetical protein
LTPGNAQSTAPVRVEINIDSRPAHRGGRSSEVCPTPAAASAVIPAAAIAVSTLRITLTS